MAEGVTHNYILYIAAFAAAFGISLVATPFSRKVSIKLGAIDQPKERGMHKTPMPRMGGIAIIMGFMLTIFILMPFVTEIRTTQFIGFLTGAVIIIILGMLDDIYSLSAKLRLAVQIIAALIVVNTGTRINFVLWPTPTFFDYFSAPVTLIWIVGLTNAVNWIDGLDGLAAGVSSIGALCLMVLCIISGSPLAVVLTSALAGSCLGFLPRNFNPAEVIMGDTGSTFLGYVLAVSSIIGVFKGYALLAVVIALFALALPIIDMLFSMLRRLLDGRSMMQADRGHLHHRLIDSGYSHKQTVIILYCLSLAAAIIAILIAVKDYRALLVAFVFFFVFLLMLFVYNRRIKKTGG